MTIIVGDMETFEPPFTPEQRLRAVLIFGEPLVAALEKAKRVDDGVVQSFVISPADMPVVKAYL